MIAILNYKKHYEGTTVLEVPNLNIPDGLHLITGQNGSGKTTLLKSIAGIIPYEGSIKIQGVKNTRRSTKAYRALVRYAPAEPVFPDYLTGADMLVLYQSILPSQPKDVVGIVHALGVDKFQQQKIGNYSSGMLKKLALALSFIGDSKLIILDEPYNALDVDASRALDQLIDEYRARGKSFLMTSHQDVSDRSWDMRLKVSNHQIIAHE